MRQITQPPIIMAPHNNLTRYNAPHLRYLIDNNESMNLSHVTTDQCDEKNWEKSYHVNLDSFVGSKKHRKHSKYTAYTDGRKT
jgi:hypothetical protein